MTEDDFYRLRDLMDQREALQGMLRRVDDLALGDFAAALGRPDVDALQHEVRLAAKKWLRRESRTLAEQISALGVTLPAEA